MTTVRYDERERVYEILTRVGNTEVRRDNERTQLRTLHQRLTNSFHVLERTRDDITAHEATLLDHIAQDIQSITLGHAINALRTPQLRALVDDYIKLNREYYTHAKKVQNAIELYARNNIGQGDANDLNSWITHNKRFNIPQDRRAGAVAVLRELMKANPREQLALGIAGGLAAHAETLRIARTPPQNPHDREEGQ